MAVVSVVGAVAYQRMEVSVRRYFFAAIAIVGIVTTANAATLGVSSDKATYSVGEQITLIVSGDAQGEASDGVYGCLVYSGSGSVSPGNQGQARIGNGWACGPIRNGSCPSDPYGPPHNGCATGGVGFSEAFNQITSAPQSSGTQSSCPSPGGNSITPPQSTDLSGAVFSVATLIATAPGVVNVSWGSDLLWFGTTSATAIGTSFVIVP
jgi:hypothetical protein